MSDNVSCQKSIDSEIKKIYSISFSEFSSFKTQSHKDHLYFVLSDLKSKLETHLDVIKSKPITT